MSDIQRYEMGVYSALPYPSGEFVTYADHVAALAAQATAHEAALAEAERQANLDLADESAAQYAKGVSDERARIRQAVEGIANDDYCYDYDCRMKAKFLSIIDGEEQA